MAVDMKKLDKLKEMIGTTKHFGDCWTYFLDNLGMNQEFIGMGMKVDQPLLRSYLEILSQQMLGKKPVASTYLFIEVPGKNFVHGGVMVPPYMLNIMYNGDTGVGIASATSLGSDETKFARFTPHLVSKKEVRQREISEQN